MVVNVGKRSPLKLGEVVVVFFKATYTHGQHKQDDLGQASEMSDSQQQQAVQQQQQPQQQLPTQQQHQVMQQ